jgi:5'-nucleotidase
LGIEYAKVISPAIDVIITGHWHANYNGFLDDPDGNPRPIVQGGHHGKLITEINLFIDPETKDVIRDKTRCRNIPNTRDVPQDPEVAQIVSYWGERAQVKRLEPVARLVADVPSERNAHGESPAADLVADAFYSVAIKGAHPVDFALTIGTPKQSLVYAKEPDMPGCDGILTLGELCAAFGAHQSTVLVTLSGEQIRQALEEQWRLDENNEVVVNFLNVSYNVRYSYHTEKLLGQRVSPADVVINGEPLDLERLYRVATNGVVAANGGGFPALTGCADLVRIAAWPVLEYLKCQDVVPVPEANRVRAITSL